MNLGLSRQVKVQLGDLKDRWKDITLLAGIPKCYNCGLVLKEKDYVYFCDVAEVLYCESCGIGNTSNDWCRKFKTLAKRRTCFHTPGYLVIPKKKKK